MKPWHFPIILLLLSCNGSELPAQQADRQVGGPCEGCEATLEFGDRNLASSDTLPGAGVDGPLLLLSGTVYRNDGTTPAEDVIIYIHHTDQQGQYQLRKDAEPWRNSGEWAQRHGSLRGWVRTNKEGHYTFLTQRPAAYPGRTDPAHIHMFIKEDGLLPYYIDDVLFEDDTLLTSDQGKKLDKRGGSGVVEPLWQEDHWVVKRDVILGQNIHGY